VWSSPAAAALRAELRADAATRNGSEGARGKEKGEGAGTESERGRPPVVLAGPFDLGCLKFLV